ncbi:MAG: hypothetical protein ACLFV5_05145 [Anaerolineales bacterium]
MDPAVPVLSVLACAVLGFMVWERLVPSTFETWGVYVALVVLTSVFVLSPHLLLFASGLGEARTPVRLEYIAGGSFLGLVVLSLLCDEMWHSQRGPDVPLSLVATCGGLLALWSPNLLGLGVGVALYGVARLVKQKGKGITQDIARAGLALLGILLGAAFLYGETATFEMAALDRFLWQHGGPHSFDLHVGLGLLMGGVALCTGLLPPFGTFDGQGDSPISHLLGLMVLLRLGLYLGAVARECFWLCLFLSLICFVWGWGTVIIHARREPLQSLGGLLAAQRGFLLLALAFVFRGQAITLLVTVAAGYVLTQGVIRLSLRWLSFVGDIPPGQLLSRVVMSAPLVGVPLGIGLLSLTGLPPTLGFIVCLEMIRLVYLLDLTWLVPWVMAMSILCLWSLAPLVLPLFRGERGGIDSSPPWPLRIALVLAAIALVFLGLFSLPLVGLTHWLVGA